MGCIEKFSCFGVPCFSESREKAGKSRINTLALRVIAAVGAMIALAAFFSHMSLLAFGAAIVSGAAFTCHLVSGSVRKKEASVETKLSPQSSSEIEESSRAPEKKLDPALAVEENESPVAPNLASEKLEASAEIGESSSPPQKALHQVQPLLAPEVPLEELQQYIKQNCQVVKTAGATIQQLQEFHEAAKDRFQKIFEGAEMFGTTVKYVTPRDLKLEEADVKQAPHIALNLKETIHIYSIATQCNGCEKKFQKQPSLGKAALQNDENSLAAMNPKLFELVSAYLSNGGFNMFAPVLTEGTKRCLLRGYLRLECDNDAKNC